MKLIAKFMLAIFILTLQPILAKDSTLTFELKESGAPLLHIKDTSNGIIIKEYEGKVVLLNFFGKHCKWCMKEIPHLVELQKKYKGKFQVVAIHAQEQMTLKERSQLENRFHFNYPIYEYVKNIDFIRYISQRAGWNGNLPFSIIFDKKGSAAQIIPGYAPKESLEKIIDSLIK
ncbi:TlpA disulfide reductase family protein [Hydrogenimonas thermophila]|uniref:TlpA family protein disulfide reductase n=1 Tax=Hydrogenimonas thermophila TaxID=223786 RepID=UPI00293733B9|nr:TlpA disulfide reductase family protein [Hydrogenimonas thermophila]WOE69478.1 TlpA disulfide reductase family protein [Hydrogenimonas thermophila]WOE71989.1 TlpA disulfide reductase family protein [Hydrogenimonas thermophila]